MNYSRPQPHRLKGTIAAMLVLGSGLLVAGGPAAPPAQAGAAGPTAVQRSLDRLVRDDGFPAALASLQRRDGRVRNLTAGVGDRETSSAVPVDGRVRIGSNTKTFTAVTVLQLVGEGKIELDAPIETYLPGLIRGEGIDGRNITVRQLLQHTSGLPNYTQWLGREALPIRHTYFQPRDLLDAALAHPAEFAPGTSWGYSNTNYIVAGLLIERVTGRPAGEAITRRTIKRIGLRRTSFPGVGEQRVRGPHPKGYHTDDPSKPLVDFTRFDPSIAWTAGQMISTPSDLNRFFTALLDGKLLGPEQLREMRSTVAAPEFGEGVGYGLGLVSTKLNCGTVSWGHGGNIPGYTTTNGATTDGRAAAVAVTALPTSQAAVDHLNAAVDSALCP